MTIDSNQDKVIYKDLSYKIVGILFDVYNELGPGYQEKYYQRAIANAFDKQNISYKKEVLIKLKFQGNKIGNYYLDFLVENKIILEVKKGDYFSKRNIEQVYAYLQATGLKLAIIANFTSTGITFRRILNIE